MVVEDHAHVMANLHQIQIRQDKGLQVDNQVFVRRKNEVVGELDDVVEVLAAAFGIELKDVGVCEMRLVFVHMLMSHAVQARLRRINETARQMVVFGAIMELHVPSHRDEEHHKGHEQRTDFQQPFFHAAKIGNFQLKTDNKRRPESDSSNPTLVFKNNKLRDDIIYLPRK